MQDSTAQAINLGRPGRYGMVPAGGGGSRGPGGAGAGPGRPGSTDGSGTPAIRDGVTDPVDTSTPAGARATTGDPIDVATGEVVMTQTDVQLPGVLPLVLSRTHVSSYRVGKWFGPSWASTLDQRLEVDGEGVCFAAADGMLLFYPVPGSDGQPVLPVEGPRLPLVATVYGYEVSDPAQGYTWWFLRSGEEVRPGVRAWPLTTIRDRNGNRIDLEYDESGALTGVRHSGGYHIGVETAGGRITRLSLGEQELVRYGYDATRQLTEVYNSSGLPMVFDYDSDGRMISWTDRIGGWYRYDYDSSGRCVRTTGAGEVLECRIAYDDASRTTSVTDSLGHTRRYVLNRARQVVQEIDPLGRVTTQQWDRYRRLLSRTDPLGRTTSYTYDEDGNLVEIVRPDGARTTATYNELRLPTTITDPDGGVRRLAYDECGNLVAVTDPTGATTRYTYSRGGRVTGATDPLGNHYRIETNPAGLPVSFVDPAQAITRYERDALGRVVAMSDPVGGVERFDWTVEGKLVRRTRPDGSTERWRYDAEGNLLEHSSPSGNTVGFEIGPFGRAVARTNPDGTRLTFDYDTELRLTTVTNPQGLRWSYEYDSAGQLVAETDFNGQTVRYRHDDAGQLAARTNHLGETVSYVRDPAGRVVQKRAGDAVATFDYSPAGRMLRARNADADVVFTRDQAGRITAETCNGQVIRFWYDAAGRRTARTTPAGVTASCAYDARGLPAALSTAGHVLTFVHDAAGREIERRLGSGVTLAQSWDANHRLLTQTLSARPVNLAATGAPYGAARLLAHRTWHYGPDGFVSGIGTDAGTERIEVDALGRITSVQGANWSERYAYDSSGNLTEAEWPAFSPDAADADVRGSREYTGTLLRRAGKVRYEYDPCGRLTLRQQKRLSGKPLTWRYSWDAENRLTSVTTPDGSRWRYRYDALGRRVAKQRVDGAGKVVETLQFVWDGPVLAEQTLQLHDHSPASASRHTTTWEWLPNSFRPLAQIETAARPDMSQAEVDRRFYAMVTDQVGSPTELVTPDGNVAWQHRTTVWGAEASARAQGVDCPLRFPGQYRDSETGAHYNYHRYYDPGAARYHSPDPLGLTPSPNPHAYVTNPQRWIDPLGLISCDTDIPWSSPGVARAAQDLQTGATSVTVRSRSEAEELFLRLYQGHGYQNATGFSPTETKDFFGQKPGTYHWDDAVGPDGHVIGHAPDNPHGEMPHLQVHTFEGPIIRIFWEP